MKKIFIAVLTVAALASCSKEQTVNVNKSEAISFENAFVENATRATDLTTTNLQDFGVYGTVAKGGNTALIFNNTKVYKGDKGFQYDVPQYWIAAADYTFTAIAPYIDPQAETKWWSYNPATTTLSFDNEAAAAEQDVLFAYAAKATETELTEQNTQPVAFIFKHILSKIAFKFENTFADGNTTLSIYNVKINNTAKKGTMAINAGVDQAWNGTDNLVVPFGTQLDDVNLNKAAAIGNGANLVVNHQYIIPAEREYVITFDVDLYQAGVYLATYNHEIKKTINFAKNGNYSLNVKLAPNTVDPDNDILYPIEFTVEDIDDWDSTNGNVALN
jgi:hypothetical protein